MLRSLLAAGAVVYSLGADAGLASTVDRDDPDIPLILQNLSPGGASISNGRAPGATGHSPIPVLLQEIPLSAPGSDQDEGGTTLPAQVPVTPVIISLISNGRDGSRQPQAVTSLPPIPRLDLLVADSDSAELQRTAAIVGTVPIPAAGLLLLAGLGALCGVRRRRPA